MSSTAKFKITGSVGGLSPYADGGYDAVPNEVLTIELEDLPALDVQRIQVEVLTYTKTAPAIAFSDGGAPQPPTTAVTTTLPATAAHTYIIQVTVYGSFDPKGVQNSDTRQRVVTLRDLILGLRKIAPAESTQYDPIYGWAEAINETQVIAAAAGFGLVGAVVKGTVKPFPAGTDNLIVCSDGATLGLVYRSYLALGTTPPSTGSQRWSDHTTVVGLDHAGVGEVQLFDWGDTSADHLTIGNNDADLDGVDIIAGAAGQFGVRVGATFYLQIAAGAITTPGNATWDLGTGTVDVDILRFGAGPPATGTQRWSNLTSIHGLDLAGAGTTSLIDWGVTTADHLTIGANDGDLEGVDIVGGSCGTIAQRIGATTVLDATSTAVLVGVSAVTMGSTLVTPTYSQAADATAAVQADNTLFTAQGASNAAGGASAGRSGVAVLYAPRSTGHVDNFDGNVALVSEPPAGSGGMEKGIFIGKAGVAPTLAPTDGFYEYVDPTTENRMCLGEDNTLTTIALK